MKSAYMTSLWYCPCCKQQERGSTDAIEFVHRHNGILYYLERIDPVE